VCACAVVLDARPASAALTLTKNSWNVIGLDGNNVSTGPNIFPVGATLCNTGPSEATNVTTTFAWDSSNGLINLAGAASVNRGTLPAGSCVHADYLVAVTRTASAYGTTRRYHITATADGGAGTATPVRELYIERLVSQNRNTSRTPSGATSVVVGQTYTYTWSGATATQGYEQIENFVAFDDRIFRVLSIQSTYSAGPSPIPGVYNDACRWNDDPASAGYRTCSGTGKAGGDVTMTFTVLIVGTGSTSLAGVIYDFSGASYHYNADFGSSSLGVTAIPGGADLSITKTDGVTTVSAGGTTTYTIVVRNAGPSSASGAVVSDPAVSGLTKTSVTCSAAGGAACPTSITVAGLESGVTIPTFPSGGSVTLTVSALVTATSGSVVNTAIVAPPAGTNDPNPGNNSATDTDTLPAAPVVDLAVTKTDGVSTVSAGGTTTYSVVVTNNGPAAAAGATVTDPAVSGLTKTAVTCTASGGAACPAPVTIAGLESGLAIPAFPSGGSVTLAVSALVIATSGSVVNTAIVAPPAGTTDSNPANNSSTDTDTLAPVTPGAIADLAVTKTDGVSTLTRGGTTTYSVVVTNNGPAAVTGATVTDAAPAGLTLGAWTCAASAGAACPASGSGDVSALVTLPVGASVTFKIAATVAADAPGSITNVASVAPPAGTSDSNPSNNTTSDIDTIPTQRIGVAKRAGTPRQVGATAFEIPYTIVVSNIGSIPATNVQVTDALDRTFVTGSPALSLVGAVTAAPLGGASAAQCSVNSAFTGVGGSMNLLTGNTALDPGHECSLALAVRGAYPTAAAVPRDPQLNVAIGETYASPGGTPTGRDPSDSGSDPAGTNPGAPGDTGGSDDPTPVVLVLPSETPADPVNPSNPSDPPSPAIASLSLTKSASLGVVDVGDVVTYSIQIRNEAGSSLPAMSVEDQLPLGFSYVGGSARLTVGGTIVRLPDPVGAQTRSLAFALPAQPGATELTLVYEVRVSAGAQQGDGTNRARAIASDGTRSNEGRARVIVSSGVFTQQACITGKVFLDVSGNGVQDPHEPGVAGVALYLEDGTSILTDSAGNFSYCGVRAGTHVLKVDPVTLPERTRLARGSNRSALDAGSMFLDVKFGEVHRADIPIAADDARVRAEVERRAASLRAGTLAVESVPAVPPAAPIPVLAAGVVEGIVSLKSLGSLRSTASRPGDVFDEELRRFSRSFNGGKTVAAGRAAMFMRGTLRNDYRVALSFDTERPDRGVLFRDIQPDAFYPIYGDASQKRFDAQASGRVYGKLERGRSHVMYGDLVTMPAENPARNLGTYARTLTGVQHRLDKGRAVINVFAARDTLRQVIDEFGGRGISGPYGVTNRNGVSGTEKIEILTRDRNQPAIVLSAQPLTRFLDYEFEPFSGRVLFRRPIPSMDEQMNPVSIRITYEVEGGGERHWVDGIDGQLKVSPRLAVGGSWAQDKSPVAPYQLASANATMTLASHTTVVAEAARSEATLNSNPFNQQLAPHVIDAVGETSGNAARLELNHEARGLQARAFAGMSDAGFYNPSATLNGGRTEAGARASYRLGPLSQLRGDLIRSGDRLTGGERHGGSIALESKISVFSVEVGLRHVNETAKPAQASSAGLLQPFGTTGFTGFGFNPIGGEIDPITGLPLVRPGASPLLTAGRTAPLGQPLDTTTVRGRLTGSFGKPWRAYAEGEQDVTGANKRMAAVGGEYRPTAGARFHARHEFMSSLDGIYALREGQRTQRTVFGVSSPYRAAGEVFSEYRMAEGISGREAQAALGLRNAWTLRDGLRLSTSVERLNPIRSAGQPATAATIGGEYTRNPRLKTTSRLEWRREAASNSWLSTSGIARQLSPDWTMLAKNFYQRTNPAGAPNQLQDRFWVGAAYRDSERNRRNLLSRYEFKIENLPRLDSPGTLGQRRVQVVSTHGDYRRSRPWMLSGQYAGKWVHDQLDTTLAPYAAHLVSGRTGYDLNRRLDVGALASVMWSGSDDRVRKAFGAEVGLLVIQNTWVSLGYNVTGFSDRDFNDVLATDSTSRGLFIRLRLKFDESLFRAKPAAGR